jgi:hypothetical protein
MRPLSVLRLTACSLLLPLFNMAQAAPLTIVEFYNSNIDHYFITNPEEAEMLDQGSAGPGWRRTGNTFQASDAATGGYAPVFRFYTSGANSHTYTFEGDSEYTGLRSQNPSNILSPNLWTAENRTFYIKSPVNTICPSGTQPVYRLYNNRAAQRDSNHRFTVDQSIVNQMLAQGWLMDGVAMCADPDPVYPSTSVLASTTAEASVSTSDGARVLIPEGAVALTPLGGEGAVTVTMARVNPESVSVPAGAELASNVYQLMPSGHVFQTAVAITIPLNRRPAADEEVVMYIQNDNGQLEELVSTYNEQSNTVLGQTRHFSMPYVLFRSRNDTLGCVQLDNTLARAYNHKGFCADRVNWLESPGDYVGSADGALGTVLAAPTANCFAGICDRAQWDLPPGNYDICIESTTKTDMMALPEFVGSKVFSNVTVLRGGREGSFGASCKTRLNISTLPPSDIRPGRYCDCSGAPTPGGTGSALEVSLLWDDPRGADLDLHIIEPSGNEIYWARDTSSSGGSLDWDNMCGNYVNGRTENISWAQPPTGTYRVVVHYWGKCAASSTSPISFRVNVTNRGQTTTYQGRVSEDQRVTVTEIVVR